MSTTAVKQYTEEEYLAMERAAEFRHEYVDGVISEKEGGTRNASLIIWNLIRSLHDATLHLQPLDVLILMRTKTSAGNYFYPDLCIVEQPDLEDTLLNPEAIIEVLRPSTEAYDRGRRFDEYSLIESLRDLILITSDRQGVHVLSREPQAETWSLRGLSAGNLHVPSLDIDLPLEAIYRKIEFESDTSDGHNDTTQGDNH